MKKALITGVTGQDGAYLSEFLLAKGYEVHGIKRRSSSFNTARVDHLFKDKHENRNHGFKLHYGDVTDSTNIIRLIKEIEPDEIYNLAAQSHVRVSFETPEYTAQADALGTLRILEAIRILGLEQKVKFYQASSSELYGKVHEVPQRETTPFYPRSPYAVAKLYAYWITINYREAYNLYACNGILFNHESPHRGETFVTRKITRAVAHIVHGLKQTLYLGNLDAKRDWGYAPDYVEAMWLMLQQEKPEDFVIATGKAHSVRDFVEAAFRHVGIEIIWSGFGPEEVGHDACSGKLLVAVDPVYFRPTEVELLVGDATKARNLLGWQPKVDFEQLVKIMMQSDLDALANGELKLVEQPDKLLSELVDTTTEVEKIAQKARRRDPLILTLHCAQDEGPAACLAAEALAKAGSKDQAGQKILSQNSSEKIEDPVANEKNEKNWIEELMSRNEQLEKSTTENCLNPLILSSSKDQAGQKFNLEEVEMPVRRSLGEVGGERGQQSEQPEDKFVPTELVAQAKELRDPVGPDQQSITTDGFIQLTLK